MVLKIATNLGQNMEKGPKTNLLNFNSFKEEKELSQKFVTPFERFVAQNLHALKKNLQGRIKRNLGLNLGKVEQLSLENALETYQVQVVGLYSGPEKEWGGILLSDKATHGLNHYLLGGTDRDFIVCEDKIQLTVTTKKIIEDFLLLITYPLLLELGKWPKTTKIIESIELKGDVLLQTPGLFVSLEFDLSPEKIETYLFFTPKLLKLLLPTSS